MATCERPMKLNLCSMLVEYAEKRQAVIPEKRYPKVIPYHLLLFRILFLFTMRLQRNEYCVHLQVKMEV